MSCAGRKYTRISAGDIATMQAARAAGESFRSIAKRLGRSAGTVEKTLARATAPAPARPRIAPRVGTRSWRPSRAMKLPHVTAEPHTRDWYDQCDAAFREAMAREFPELAQKKSKLEYDARGRHRECEIELIREVNSG